MDLTSAQCICRIWHLLCFQVKTDYQHAVKEGIVDLGFQNPSKAAQLTAHHIDQVKVVHPIPDQGCINLDRACGPSGRVVTGMQVTSMSASLAYAHAQTTLAYCYLGPG